MEHSRREISPYYEYSLRGGNFAVQQAHGAVWMGVTVHPSHVNPIPYRIGQIHLIETQSCVKT